MFDFAVFVLAVARLTRLVTDDSLLARPRGWLLARFPAENTEMPEGPDTFVVESTGLRYATHPHWIGGLITCRWCAGFWIAALCWAISTVFPPFWAMAGWILAASYLVGFLAGRE